MFDIQNEGIENNPLNAEQQNTKLWHMEWFQPRNIA